MSKPVLVSVLAALMLLPVAGRAQTAALPSPSPSAAPGELFVVVPFAPPDNKDRALDFADDTFMAKLSSHGIRAVHSPPMDAIDAATSAASLCERFKADGLIIGTVWNVQHAAPFYKSPTHSEIRIERLNCAGRVVWKGVATGDVNRLFGSPSADASAAIDVALNGVVQQLAENLNL